MVTFLMMSVLSQASVVEPYWTDVQKMQARTADNDGPYCLVMAYPYPEEALGGKHKTDYSCFFDEMRVCVQLMRHLEDTHHAWAQAYILTCTKNKDWAFDPNTGAPLAPVVIH